MGRNLKAEIVNEPITIFFNRTKLKEKNGQYFQFSLEINNYKIIWKTNLIISTEEVPPQKNSNETPCETLFFSKHFPIF